MTKSYDLKPVAEKKTLAYVALGILRGMLRGFLAIPTLSPHISLS